MLYAELGMLLPVLDLYLKSILETALGALPEWHGSARRQGSYGDRFWKEI